MSKYCAAENWVIILKHPIPRANICEKLAAYRAFFYMSTLLLNYGGMLMSANRCLFWFYEHLTEDINEVVKKGLALDKWAEAHGGNPPIDDSLDSHDWWDHFPLVMPPEKFFGKLPFIPPTQEGEAFANLVRGVIVERHNDNAQLWLCPYSHIEFVMLFQYDKYTSYFSHRKELVAWVAELRQAYIDLLG